MAIRGLIGEEAAPEVKDAALIAAAPRVEHDETGGYGTVQAYAKLLKGDAIAKLLEQTLAEEQATDKALSELAESTFKIEAE
jgi:ferritin-like metal-binding protein YciE